MSGKFMEWISSKSDIRVRLYREARLAYETYVSELGVSFDSLTTQHHARAAADDRLAAAEQSSRQAVELSRQANIQIDTATGLNQLGMIQHLRGSLTEASATLRGALSILENLPQLDHARQTVASNCYYHLGVIALKQGKIDEAKRWLNRSLVIDRAAGDLLGASVSRSALAKCGESVDEDFFSDANVEPASPERESALINDLRATVNNHTIAYKRSSQFPSLDVVWLLSFSTVANDLVMLGLEKLDGRLNRKLMVSRVAFGSADHKLSFPPALPPDSRLCAAILVIEKEGVSDKDFQYWASWCIDHTTWSDDFNLFVCTTEQEMRASLEFSSGSQSAEFLERLRETIQLPHALSIEQLLDDLSNYLQNLDRIRDRALWRRRRLSLTVTLGRLAFFTQTFSFVMLGITVIIAFFRGNEFVTSRLVAINPAAATIIAGAVLFPLLTIPMFLFFQGPSVTNSLLKENPRIGLWFLLGVLLGPATIGLPQRLGAGFSLMALGVVAGILVEVARRSGQQAKRSQISLERAQSYTGDTTVSTEIARQAGINPINPFRCPLFPAPAPRVFLSYTTQSEWSLKTASTLHENLRGAGCECFFDKAGIATGDSWRRKVHQSIADANVFIALLDDRSVTREWVAAELITALSGRQITSLPDIVLLINPELAESKSKFGLPVFRAVLGNTSAPYKNGHPRLITFNEATMRTIVAGLSPYRYYTPSVFPPYSSLLILLITIPAAAIGSLGTVFGFPAPFLALLQHWDKYNSSAILSDWGILSAVYLLCGYWLGFTARLTVASRFEVDHKNVVALTRINAWGAIGFFLLLAVWASQVSVLVVGWAIALGGLGWIIGHSLIMRTRK